MVTLQIAKTQAVQLRTAPGFLLRSDAAASFDRVCDAFGKRVLLTGAWRSFETQLKIFLERYEVGAFSPFNDYRKYDGKVWGRVRGAAAAVPGTSNHGGGIAFDAKTRRAAGDKPYEEAVVFTAWQDPDRLRFLEIAREHGWADDEGRQVNELWHITYYQSRDKHRGGAVVRPAIAVDGVRGSATITRWQEVMGTKADGKISKPDSALIRADQKFLNSVVSANHIKSLTGASKLKEDGDEGKRTIIVRQFWLRNHVPQDVQRSLTGHLLAFDGDQGARTVKVFQYALNRATVGSKKY